MSKSGDNISKENASWNFKGDVVKKFDNHVSKSVPIYNRGHDLIIQLSDFFIKDDSLVYDLGCSTGKLLINLVEHNKHKINSKFIGLDIERDMISYANDEKKKFNINTKKLKFLAKDLVNYKLEDSDFIISFFTIQFIHPKHRQKLINNLPPEGAMMRGPEMLLPKDSPERIAVLQLPPGGKIVPFKFVDNGVEVWQQ